MSIDELRIAFNFSENIAERIRKFIENRISKTLADDMPVIFRGDAKLILHLIPVSAFDPSKVNDDLARATETLWKLRPLSCSGWNHRYNIDGFLTYCPDLDGKCLSYVQFFRNGIIEAVDGLILEPRDGKKILPIIALEEEIIESLGDFLDILKELNIEPPIFVFVSLSGVKDYTPPHDIAKYYPELRHPVDRDILILPEILIEKYDCEVDKMMRPCFDALWNSCGLPKSLSYDKDGRWKGHG